MSGAIIRHDTTACLELTDDITFKYMNIDNITDCNYWVYLADLTFIFDESTIQRALRAFFFAVPDSSFWRGTTF